MIAAQQYYIEYNNDLNSERLLNLLPNYIPDYCLTGDKPVDYWHQLITQAFKKVGAQSWCLWQMTKLYINAIHNLFLFRAIMSRRMSQPSRLKRMWSVMLNTSGRFSSRGSTRPSVILAPTYPRTTSSSPSTGPGSMWLMTRSRSCWSSLSRR